MSRTQPKHSFLVWKSSLEWSLMGSPARPTNRLPCPAQTVGRHSRSTDKPCNPLTVRISSVKPFLVRCPHAYAQTGADTDRTCGADTTCLPITKTRGYHFAQGSLCLRNISLLRGAHFNFQSASSYTLHCPPALEPLPPRTELFFPLFLRWMLFRRFKLNNRVSDVCTGSAGRNERCSVCAEASAQARQAQGL